MGGVWAWPRVSAQVFKTEVHSAEIVVVSPAQAATAVTATGYVIALTSARVVSARTPGRIAVVHVHEGDMVHAGQPLIELDATDVRSAVAAAHAR